MRVLCLVLVCSCVGCAPMESSAPCGELEAAALSERIEAANERLGCTPVVSSACVLDVDNTPQEWNACFEKVDCGSDCDELRHWAALCLGQH